MNLCPCHSQKTFDSCCKPYIERKHQPPTPEALMRSRYTAFTLANIEYIRSTMAEKALHGFNVQETELWAKKVQWINLDVLLSHLENSETGFVEFEASYIENHRLKIIHEKSKFLLKNNRWYYVEGSHLPPIQTEQIIARNTKCPCGSQKKYKNCHDRHC